MKGVYAVFLYLEESKSIEIGAKGEIDFKAGVYVYIGSAMNGVENRLKRHYSSEKNNYWHIDYFTDEASPFYWLAFPLSSRYECVLAEACEDEGVEIEGFGASDCDCSAHLFYLPSACKQVI